MKAKAAEDERRMYVEMAKQDRVAADEAGLTPFPFSA